MDNNQFAQDLAKALEHIDKEIEKRKRFDHHDLAFEVSAGGKTPMADLLIKRAELIYEIELLEEKEADEKDAGVKTDGAIFGDINDVAVGLGVGLHRSRKPIILGKGETITPIKQEVVLRLHNHRLGVIQYEGGTVKALYFDTPRLTERYREWLELGEGTFETLANTLNTYYTDHVIRGYVELSTVIPPKPAQPLNPIPLGLESKEQWLRRRLHHMNVAIQRRMDNEQVIPVTWNRERNELLDQIVHVERKST